MVHAASPRLEAGIETWILSVLAEMAQRLVTMFTDNFHKFEAHVDSDVKAAAPSNQLAAQ